MSYKDRRRFLWILFLIGLVLIAIVAQATTLVRLRFTELVHYSYSIARVRCVRSRTTLENGEIWTDTTFRVLWQKKGYLPEEIVVRQLGGKFLHLHSHVDETPEFRLNEEVYLFLSGRLGHPFNIVGWTQGTFGIHRDPVSNVETVTQDFAETPVFDPASDTFTRGGTTNLPAEIFEQRIFRETLRQAEVPTTTKKRGKPMHTSLQEVRSLCMTCLFTLWSATTACGYSFNEIVPDVRQPASVFGGSACPVPSQQLTGSAAIAFRWSTVLGTNPTTILTQDQTPTGSLNEIQQVIEQSMNVWANVSGTTLTPASFAPLTQMASSNACGSDGINSICFDQPDSAFTPGVLAFTRVITADQLGIQLGSSPPATQIGQILDADIYFNPSDSIVTFATPAALPANPQSYDLESLLIHEFGHSLGFGHSAVWSAMMYPFAAAPGTFTNLRPTAQQPDAPLSDDDRTGLRVLYHDPSDTQFVGSIQGRILPANPLSLPATPPGVTGIFGAHVVAVDATSGAVVAGTLGGWSCQAPGPTQFDGTYSINQLPINRSYKIYAEPLNGVVGPAQVSTAIVSLCRNATTDPGWPPLQACVVPQPDLEFTTADLSSP